MPQILAEHPLSGVGLGLRSEWAAQLLSQPRELPFVEVLADNFLGDDPRVLRLLEAVRAAYPITLHCVGMNLGSIDALETGYIDGIRRLADQFDPLWVSDHLCWIGANGVYAHDLLPLPFNEDVAVHCGRKIAAAQDLLGRRILVENVSRYLTLKDDCLSEWDFLSAVVSEADCDLLLDINNVEVSARNLGFEPATYLAGLPTHRVRQLHLAGYEDWGDICVDTHSRPVSDGVLLLLGETLSRFGNVPASLEWDRDIPPLERLLDERGRLAQAYDRAKR